MGMLLPIRSSPRRGSCSAREKAAPLEIPTRPPAAAFCLRAGRGPGETTTGVRMAPRQVRGNLRALVAFPARIKSLAPPLEKAGLFLQNHRAHPCPFPPRLYMQELGRKGACHAEEAQEAQ
jgi:hypothetical protein